MPPRKHPENAVYIVFFVCWAYFVQYLLTTDASSKHTPKCTLYSFFLCVEHTFCNTFWQQMPPQKHRKEHSILFFSYVEYTFSNVFWKQMPPWEDPKEHCRLSLELWGIWEYRGILTNIMEYRWISGNHGLPWKVAAYTRVSWNIEEYRGIAWNIM